MRRHHAEPASRLNLKSRSAPIKKGRTISGAARLESDGLTKI